MQTAAVEARRFRVFALASGSGGNPADVIVHDGITTSDDYAKIARDKGVELTIVYQNAPKSVEFYSPGGPLAFCGHGMLAAACAEAGSGDWEFFANGTLIQGHNERHQITYAEYEGSPAFAQRLKTEQVAVAFAYALRLPRLAVLDLICAGGERQKALLVISSRDAFNEMAPDVEAIHRLCDLIGTTGLYAIVAERGDALRARHFPLGAGMIEDPATGNGVLAILSARRRGLLDVHNRITVSQGVEMGVPCELRGFLDGDRARIGGFVVEDVP